jgi:F0F1-type ATP synthase delta subunit
MDKVGKIEQLDDKIAEVIEKFAEQNPELNIHVDSDYIKGTIKISIQ